MYLIPTLLSFFFNTFLLTIPRATKTVLRPSSQDVSTWHAPETRHMDSVHRDYRSATDATEFLARTHQPRYQGSVIVIHARGGVIRPHYITALNKYLNDVKATGGRPSKAGFEAFWETYKVGMTVAGLKMNRIPSPYSADSSSRESEVDPNVDRIREMLYNHLHQQSWQ
jgi:hypothetical protein